MATGNVLAGGIIYAEDVQDELDALSRGAIMRASRSTSSTAASAAQGVLRLDSVPLLAGRRYLIRTNTLILTSSVAADRGTARLSMSTSGTATTGSTQYAVANSPAIDSTTDGCEVTAAFSYTPASNETASILLWTQRLTGTGNVRLLVTGSVSIDIEVVDMGISASDTGVDI